LSCGHVFLRLFLGKDSFGDDYETELNGKDLFLAFGPLGQLEGEMMNFIINQWKADPARNHVFSSGSRVILPSYFLTVIITITCVFFSFFLFCE
jgi:hypothetical protein